jgi:hypothetical protein
MIREGNAPMISIYAGLDNELASLIEQELISKHGRKDLGRGSLLNLTDGGEGATGRVATPQFRLNMSRGRLGKKPSDTSNYKRAAENRVYTAERNANVSKGLQGHAVTAATRAKISDKNKISSHGERNGMFGKTHGKDTKAKIGAKVRARAAEKRALKEGGL